MRETLKGVFPQMDSYKRPYFTLFCAICETIEELEQILKDKNLSRKNATALWVQVKKLKQVQQLTEEILIESTE